MPSPMRVLASVFPKPELAENPTHFDASSSIQELASAGCFSSVVEVKILSNPTFGEFKSTVASYSPTLVYLVGPTSFEHNKSHGTLGPLEFSDGERTGDEFASAFDGSGVETLYLDAATDSELAAKVQGKGVPHVITWPNNPSIPAVVAAQFSHVFFSFLLNFGSTIHEAFALANHGVQAHCTSCVDGQYYPPALPALMSGQKAALPDNNSIPQPNIPGIDASQGLASSVAGWADIRLLAPRAELRLLLTGSSTLIDGSKLSFLGEALRALLVMETRTLTLLGTQPSAKVPANLPAGCTALRCEVRTASGAEAAVILGGQPAVLQDAKLVEHALRMTLVADSLSLQFRLPPPGIATPQAHVSAAVAGAAPVVDSLVLTSVWAVQVLRSLCLNNQYKPMISLGVAAVGGSATMGVSAVDAQRLKIITSGLGPAAHPLAPIQPPNLMAEHAAAGNSDALAGTPAGGDAQGVSIWLQGYDCKRPPLHTCTETEFLDDLVCFLTLLRGKPIDRSAFPNVVLNNSSLDLWSLYRGVVARGGFRMGSHINWKGQIFRAMRNWTADNKQTGVGNSLKRHYQNLLLEYEMAHAGDVTLMSCTICTSGDSSGIDWVCCEVCEQWVHLSCDQQAGFSLLGAYYSDDGTTYTCPSCRAKGV